MNAVLLPLPLGEGGGEGQPRVEEPSARYLVDLQPPLMRNFDLLATAPQGVAKLRELILSLAVQGKLVTQDSNEEPAALALKRAGLERDDRNIKRLSAISDAADSMENRRRLPRGWLAVPLGQLISSIKSGGTPSKQNPAYWNGDIPWASVKDLKFGEPIRDTQDKITSLGLAEGAALAEKGSVIICTRMGLGKIGEATRDIAINQDLKAVRLLSCISNAYFINYFQTLSIIGSGMTVAGIKQDELLSLVVPLPPLAEQARIVARVEELMKLCDALEERGRLEAEQHARLVSTLFDSLAASENAQALAENWQRIARHFDLLLDRPEAIDALEQTILHLAVRGLLVLQDPSDEPASRLLDCIRTDGNKQASGRKIKQLPPIDEDNTPFPLPSGWAWARFPELGEFGRGKSKHRPRNDPALFTPGIYPLVQTGEVARAKGVIADYHSKYSDIGLAQSKLWPKGTLCITIAANIADVAILGFDACFPDSVVGFVPHTEIGDASYLLTFMETAREHLIEFAPSTAQKNINLEILESMLIPLPPAAELKRIVARVQQLRALCAQLRERLQQARRTQGLLAEALVQQTAGAGK